MARNATHSTLTPRDLLLLEALSRAVLTATQLRKLSTTWPRPFTHDRAIRHRLQLLALSGFVRRFRYLIAAGTAENYYVLTLDGYRILHGPDARPRTKRSFYEVAISRQFHTRALADVVMHLLVGAHQVNSTVKNFYREGALRLPIDDEALIPDGALELHRGSEVFRFFLELDNHSETVRSNSELDSWERKLRLYEAHQDRCPDRFRVLLITTRSTSRRDHILDLARTVARNPARRLLYGIFLPNFLAATDALTTPHFLDHHGKAVSLLPGRTRP